jgi:predicted nucleic acid-binding protein
MRLLLDTSVLIDFLRGRPAEAIALVNRALVRGDELWSCEVVRAELLAGMRVSEEAATRELLGLLAWVSVDDSLAEAAGALGRRYLKSHPGIDIADLLVAASAERLDAALKTTNVKHFPMFKGLRPPY